MKAMFANIETIGDGMYLFSALLVELFCSNFLQGPQG